MEPEQSRKETKINGNWQNIQIVNMKPEMVPYLNRRGHCCLTYKNSLIMYGGQLLDLDKQKPDIQDRCDPMVCSSYLFRFSFSIKEWSKHCINMPINHNLSHITNFGHASQANMLFIFGGINSVTGELRPSELVTINLDSYVMKRLEIKGMSPTPCENPSMLFLNRGSLILYGGRVQSPITGSMQYDNSMYVYKIDQRVWIRIDDNYQLKIPTLARPNLLILSENQFYLFGGYQEIVSNNGDPTIHEVYNQNFYRLKPISKHTSTRPDVLVRKIYPTNKPPFGPLLSKSFGYQQKYIVCLEEDRESRHYNSLWFFDPSTVTWMEVKQENLDIGYPIVSSSETRFVSINDRIYTVQKDGKIALLLLNSSFLEKDMKQTVGQCELALCSVCENSKITLNPHYSLISNELSTQKYQEHFESLSFPFAAIGLLVDNSKLTDAKNCNIMFGYKEVNNLIESSKYILVEDNGQACKIWNKQITSDMFIKIAGSLSVTGFADEILADENMDLEIVKAIKEVEGKEKAREKELQTFLKQHAKGSQNLPSNALIHIKTEKDFEKEHIDNVEKKHQLEYKRKITRIGRNRKLYISNIKSGGVRLGKLIIYASKEKIESLQGTTELKEIRRYIIMASEVNESSKQEEFNIYSYITVNGACSDAKSENICRHVTKEYKKDMKIVTERLRNMNNVVMVSNLTLVEDENSKPVTELQFKKKYNDVFYGDVSHIINQENPPFDVQECCDISLKTYLSLLYLDTDTLISIAVRENSFEHISPQQFLQVIDHLKPTYLYDIDSCFDFGDYCDILEIYWNPEKIPKPLSLLENSFLLNGVLIYYKGRLIGRFRSQLGTLLDNLDTDPMLGKMIGYLQVKDMFPVNMTRTGFTHPGILQKFYSRLNFVMKYMERECGKERESRRPPVKEPKPTKKVKYN